MAWQLGQNTLQEREGDLFSCLWVRNVGMSAEHAQLGFMTLYRAGCSLGLTEKLRKFVIPEHDYLRSFNLSIQALAEQPFPSALSPLQKGYCPVIVGLCAPIRLRWNRPATRALEALQTDCGWFYQTDLLRRSRPLMPWATNHY